ncbi:MAG: hypothetical protein KIS86_02620 [Devosia sp.]|nr:hypothetical protein [Devosia sp.]
MAQWKHIELCAGKVTSARIETQDAFFDLTDWHELYRYFVYAVDENGVTLGLDTLDDYQDAFEQAEKARIDFGIGMPVRNRIAEAH